MAKKKKKAGKKAKKSNKKVKREYIPRKTIVNVPDKPIDPAKIERERKRKYKERKEKRLMEKMGMPYEPKTEKTSKPVKIVRIQPVVMGEVPVKFRKDYGAKAPSYGYSDDAGLEIYANEEKILKPMHRAPIKTGVYFELPKGYAGLIWDRSGLSLRTGLHAIAGAIDSGYREELKVVLINLSSKTVKIEKGTKIAQLLIQKVERAKLHEYNPLEDSERGGGFESSGLKETKERDDFDEDDDDGTKEINPILEIDMTRKKPRHTVKISKEKPQLKEDIKKAIKEDTENHLF